MKSIIFAGLKGGCGKTTLSLQFTKFLHYYERKRVKLVCLEGVSMMGTLSRAMRSRFLVEDLPIETYLQSGVSEDTDYAVIDCASDSISQLRLLRKEQGGEIVIPFQYQNEDFFRLLYLVKSLNNLGLHKKLTLLPNKFNPGCGVQSDIMELFGANKFICTLPRLPLIIQSTKILDFNFLAPSQEILNIVRDSFLHIIKVYNY